jgi:iron complex outermembrane receptor protein
MYTSTKFKAVLKNTVSAGCFAVAGLAAPHAFAQDGATSNNSPTAAASAPDAYEGDVVVVTAQKRRQSINDVGISIAALSGAALAERQIVSLSDLAQAVPGLTYTESGSNTPVYTLRGIGFYETTISAYPSVSIYVDEAPLPFPVMTKNMAYDLERVEVLKGPQGSGRTHDEYRAAPAWLSAPGPATTPPRP